MAAAPLSLLAAGLYFSSVVAACPPDLIMCPTLAPSAGVCVPTLVPWCDMHLFKNPYADERSRIVDLVGRLSLEQKVVTIQPWTGPEIGQTNKLAKKHPTIRSGSLGRPQTHLF